MQPTQHVTTQMIQIICTAMILGIVTFGAIAFAMAMDDQPDAQPVLAIVGLGSAVVAFLMSLFVPRIVQQLSFKTLKRSGIQLERKVLQSVLAQSLIVKFAILEGAAFLNLVAYILEKQPWGLLAAGWMLLVIAVSFPTQQRIDNWIESQLQLFDFDN